MAAVVGAFSDDADFEKMAKLVTIFFFVVFREVRLPIHMYSYLPCLRKFMQNMYVFLGFWLVIARIRGPFSSKLI
jgi:hypothetical protein